MEERLTTPAGHHGAKASKMLVLTVQRAQRVLRLE